MAGESNHKDKAPGHVPVLLAEVLRFMNPKAGKKFIDATGGPGNMSRALLDQSSPSGRVLTIDCDPRATAEQETLLGDFGDRSVRRIVNFSEIESVARDEGFIPCHGVVYDLGMSSTMIDRAEYGFSIQHDAPLDMRMNPESGITARDLVNTLSEQELVELLRGMDESRFARNIARAIVKTRNEKPIETTSELAGIVEKAVPRRFHPRRIHVATRTFLALRVAVNNERENLERSLDRVIDILAAGGVLVVICYSSFEDRILRAAIRESASRWERLTGKAIRPDEDEVSRNPRSRSARLRAYRKIA
jgi:16S rRNA (cytosine1402-N4)-methyltransferase